MDDYYSILGVGPEADDTELRRVWRELARKWHPDRAGSDTTFIFQKLSLAYEVLSDPVARAAYDRDRTAPAAGRRAPGVLLSRLSGTLPVLVASGVARFVAPGLVELDVEPGEAAEGGMVRIAMRVEVRDGGEEPYSAWLAVRPGVVDGTVITPSAQLPGVIRPVTFRVRVR